MFQIELATENSDRPCRSLEIQARDLGQALQIAMKAAWPNLRVWSIRTAHPNG